MTISLFEFAKTATTIFDEFFADDIYKYFPVPTFEKSKDELLTDCITNDIDAYRELNREIIDEYADKFVEMIDINYWEFIEHEWEFIEYLAERLDISPILLQGSEIYKEFSRDIEE